MEHLICLSKSELVSFIITADLEVLQALPHEFVLRGESIFTWQWDSIKGLFCFLKPQGV